MAHNFQKIHAPFGRVSPNDRLVSLDIYARPWVRSFYESEIPMYASEKIDGTSVGIVWDGERVSFVGHTDKSQFAPRYLEYLKGRFGTPEFESVLEGSVRRQARYDLRRRHFQGLQCPLRISRRQLRYV